MRNQTDQTGFSAIAFVLIVVVVAVVSGVGYYVWHNSQTKPTVTVSKTSVVATKPKTTTTINPYAGWKEYCGPIEKACFKYPSDWTLVSEESHEPVADRVFITAPSGSVVKYDSGVSGIGGGCDPSTDTHAFVTKAENQKNVSGLYVVSTGKGDMTTENIGLSSNQDKGIPATGDTGQCSYYTIFSAHHDTTLGVWLQTTKIAATNDIPTIENILQSYYYQ